MAEFINWDITVHPVPGAGYTIPTYGNYGGPGYGDDTYNTKFRDALDAVFRAHDKAYGDVYKRNLGKLVKDFSKADLYELAQADKVAIEAILNLPPDALASNDAKAYAGAAILGFIYSNIKGTYGAASILSLAEEIQYDTFAALVFIEGMAGIYSMAGIVNEQDSIWDDTIDQWGLLKLVVDNLGVLSYEKSYELIQRFFQKRYSWQQSLLPKQ